MSSPLSLITLITHLLPFILAQAVADRTRDLAGTCYYAAGKTAPPQYAPCGDATVETRSCCEFGDNCMSNNACYGSSRKVDGRVVIPTH